MSQAANALSKFDGVTGVVADPLRFKRKLAIGEDAYASLRLKKHLAQIWDVGGAAATGAGAAASPVVASTFFASSTGFLGWLGLGTAATPIGWVVAAALASGGAYYGVVCFARRFAGSRVETIPKFINTPLDLLAASLLDLIVGLAAKLAWIDGQVDERERALINAHFVEEWGFDPHYVVPAVDLLLEGAPERLKERAEALTQFLTQNPDCNATALRDEVLHLLKQVAEADGVIDEREELALDAVRSAFEGAHASTLTSAVNAVTAFAGKVPAAASKFRNAKR